MTETSKSFHEESSLLSKKVSRRNMLKTAGAGGIGVLMGASGLRWVLIVDRGSGGKGTNKRSLFLFTEIIKEEL